MVNKIVILAVVCFVAIQTAQSLKCYQCSDCADIGNTNSTDCKDPPTPKPEPTTTKKPDPKTTKKPDPKTTKQPDPKTTKQPDPKTTKKPDAIAAQKTTPSKTTTQKSDGKWYCATITYSTDGKSDKVDRVCTHDSHKCDNKDDAGVVSDCKVCEKDDCNGSGAGSIQSWTLTALITAAILKFYL